jgi:RimJ/RimL family protein N-acetyltransferase
VITGERVTLRAVRPEDYPAIYEWRTALDTWGDTSDKPAFPWAYADFVAYMDRLVADPERAAEWAVETRDGELVGRATMFSFDPLSRNAEVGLVLAPEHRGRGYGREVLRMLLEFGFTHRNLHRVWLETTSTNERALRSYAAAGFVEEGRLREHAWVAGRYVDMVRMAVLRREWEAS